MDTQIRKEYGAGVSSNDFGALSNISNTLDLKYSLQQLDNSVGLSNSSVNTIFQDSENLLWIGTWDGLNRYDGNTFKIFRPGLNSENGLSNQVILKIAEDDTGHIWVLTMYGINRFDKKTNTFRPYYFSRKNRPPISESEFNMAVDGLKKVFCAVKGWGVGYFDGADFQKLPVNGLPTGTIKKMRFTPSGKLLLLFDNNELYALEIQTNATGKKSVSNMARISKNIRAFGILPDQKMCLIDFAGEVGIYSFLDKTSRTLPYKNMLDVIGQTANGLLLSGKAGYFSLDVEGEMFVPPWQEYLGDREITTLATGSENVIWAGTDGDGLLKMYPQRKPFNLLSTTQIPELNKSIVRAFTQVDGQSFFVGTKGKGLFRFSSKFYQDPGKKLEYEIFNEDNSSINNSVFALHKGQDNLVFVGTDGDGIHVFDSMNRKLINWSEMLGNELCNYFRSTYAIYQDKKGFIWLGTNGYGLVRFKLERKGRKFKITHFKIYQAGNEQDNTLSSNIIYSIVPKNEDELWIGTRLGGLNLFNKKTALFKVYKNSNNDPKSLSNNDILCLHVDEDKKLWIGTSLGLNVLENMDRVEPVFRNFTVMDGLPNNTVHGIVSDGDSNLWISTNLGLSNFLINESKFINYTKNEGLQNNEFADGAAYRDSTTGFIFMGGIKGFNFFSPSQIETSTHIPDILIDKINGQNQEEPYYQGLVVSPGAKTNPSIVLKHDQNFFDIELTALTYVNSEKCQYAYQLGNFDQDWNTINNRKNFSFTNVPSGKYSLWLKWTNSDGIWGDPVKAIDIHIKPIFWQSTPAIFLYILLLFLLLLLVFSYYKKRQSLKQNILFQKREQEIHRNRLTFFTNIAHELQTPLTLIVGPVQKLSQSLDISEKNQRFIKMIQRNSSRLLFLTQQLLEFRKAEYDHLEVMVKQFDLVNLVEQIAELFDEWALQKNIDYSVDIPSELKGWFDKDKIEKIVFNLLSNAFKYTPQDGKVHLKFLIEDDNSKRLTIRTTNTGSGIPKHKLNSLFDRFSSSDIVKSSENDLFRTGIGLAYIKKLVSVMRGELLVSSKENGRTTFSVLLPCHKEAFDEKEQDAEVQQVYISHHLQNILADVSSDPEEANNKISTLESILNERRTILIVEDEKEIHGLLIELLKEQYTILTAYNGIEALEIIKTKMPDIIISDVMMPEMDGIELCGKIKGDTKTCHIPFVMLTAKTSVSHRIEGLESGANAYIPKPFHPDHLLVRIQKLLEEKELIFQHFAQDTFGENLYQLPILNEDKDFMGKVIALIRDNIDCENLQSQYLEKELGMSSSRLYRKIKQITGFSLGDLIRTVRLKFAAELLQNGTLSVTEVCYRSGFNNRSYFYREFKKIYHITPKNYQLKYRSGHNI
ncbi:two-component regulator propeller domain-containing protein [Spongiimicrobium sp. 3-5]|uniref:hybrid sensor histidine kinase/response regulator transcription factor n=1 Tax=Spongiimicrobium sp. 3-5 TaxID=3332596 RepID=UPI0039812ABF